MLEAEIKFSREDREGVVAVGTYLIDAAKRFGIHFEDVCNPEAAIHHCSVVVASGSNLLSGLTKAEEDYFASNGRKTNERLACQVKIDKAGEVEIMTDKKVKDPEPEAKSNSADSSEEYRKAFEEMPLEKKIANLVQLETIALGETVSFIINSPFKVADKLMDVMAEFGFKKEERQKESARPAEHKAASASAAKPKTKKKAKDEAGTKSSTDPGPTGN
jgi:ferredoxin